MIPSASLAAAIKDVASTQKTSFATTQAVWRFLNNENVTFTQLNQPMRALAHQESQKSAHCYALVAHDWSRLQFRTHTKKAHRLKMSHAGDVGYELQSSLLIEAERGLPIAPLSQSLTDDRGCYCSFEDKQIQRVSHMDGLVRTIEQIESLDIKKNLVHLIDREGDSIGHMRKLSSKGYQWLLRAKEGNHVEYQGQKMKLSEVADGLTCEQTSQVEYKGQKAFLAVSETDITITRPAKPKKFDGESGRRVAQEEGAPLKLRLVVAELRDKDGHRLSRWSLVTNVSKEVKCDEIAKWYYWRLNIESFFKLIKRAGHDVESWLQRSAGAILKRLLIASMACVLTWRVQRGKSEEDKGVRIFLCRLSGRQQKRGRIESAPSLLAGLSILLSSIQLLSEYSIEELRELSNKVMSPLISF
jgi:hypothetical protein